MGSLEAGTAPLREVGMLEPEGFVAAGLCTLVWLLSQGLPSQPQEASTFCLLPDLFVIFYPWNSAFDEFLEVFVCVCVGEWRIDLLLILFLPWDETLV